MTSDTPETPDAGDPPVEAPDATEQPRRRPRPDVRIFAHRGASGEFPEHTRAAYLRALEEGADGLEIDVHLTRDGEVVCFHDATVARTTGSIGAVADLTLRQMRGLDVFSWKNAGAPTYGGVRDQLMTLAEVLDLLCAAGRPVSLAIEIKHPSPFGHRLEDRVFEVLTAYGWDPDTSTVHDTEHRVEISFMSFSPGSLLHMREIVPDDKLCALISRVTDAAVRRRLDHVAFSAALRPATAVIMRRTQRENKALIWSRKVGLAGPGVAYVRAHQAEVRAWVARGNTLRVWTVDSTEDVDLLLSLGVKEITTNYPALIRQHLSVSSASVPRATA